MSNKNMDSSERGTRRLERLIEFFLGWGPSVKFRFLCIQYSLFSIFLLFAMIVLILVWPLAFAGLWPRIQELTASPLARIAVVGALFVLSLLLYLIRQSYRVLYGIVEVVLGLLGCWITLGSQATDRLTISVGVAGSVYIVIRGFDNYFQGRKQLLPGS
jgi:hypothetical protein